MRFLRVSCASAGRVSAIALSTLFAGCGGAAAQDVLDSNTAPAATSPDASGSNRGTSDASSATGDGGPVSAECPKESEPNDDADTANTLAPTLCGTIQPSGESDFLTFELQKGAKSMDLQFSGPVILRVQVDGQTVILGANVPGIVPFAKNARYVVEVRALDPTASVSWRVDLVEK